MRPRTLPSPHTLLLLQAARPFRWELPTPAKRSWFVSGIGRSAPRRDTYGGHWLCIHRWQLTPGSVTSPRGHEDAGAAVRSRQPRLVRGLCCCSLCHGDAVPACSPGWPHGAACGVHRRSLRREVGGQDRHRRRGGCHGCPRAAPVSQ